MNIVVFDTAIGTSNRGDDIILEGAEKALSPLLDECFVMRFATHLNNFKTYQYFRNGMKLKYADTCDYKFIMGTNLLTSDMFKTRGQWPINPISKRLYTGSIMVGVGTTFDNGKVTNYTKSIYKSILRSDIIHSVRDEQSKALLESVGVKAINTGCPTLWELTPEVCVRIPTKKAKNVIITLSGYSDQKDPIYDQKLLSEIEKMYDKIYFWVQTSEDGKYLDSLKTTKDIAKIYSMQNFKEVCKSGDVDYVGTRLHGGVFAMQNGVRSLVIAIDHRARGFHESNNLNILERTEVENLSSIMQNEMKTEIVLNQKEINAFLSQFPYVREKIKNA